MCSSDLESIDRYPYLFVMQSCISIAQIRAEYSVGTSAAFTQNIRHRWPYNWRLQQMLRIAKCVVLVTLVTAVPFVYCAFSGLFEALFCSNVYECT